MKTDNIIAALVATIPSVSVATASTASTEDIMEEFFSTMDASEMEAEFARKCKKAARRKAAIRAGMRRNAHAKAGNIWLRGQINAMHNSNIPVYKEERRTHWAKPWEKTYEEGFSTKEISLFWEIDSLERKGWEAWNEATKPFDEADCYEFSLHEEYRLEARRLLEKAATLREIVDPIRFREWEQSKFKDLDCE